MAAEPTVGAGSTIELALHGPDPEPDLAALVEALTAAGAASVDRVRLTAPASDQRVAELVEVCTLIIGGAVNVVSIIETVRGWLAARRESAARRAVTAGADDVVPSVVITIGDQRLEITHPSDRAQSDAIARFLDLHRRDG
ncbi:hypothetical protein [Streptomyces sp. NPDC046821]|uniref:hypothetical protein n=1 Tax=Streptomyces sp. NPDC046821 TaxID=3154702 RepID=UPI0033D14FBC